MAARSLVLPREASLSEEVGEFVEQLNQAADLPSSRAYWLRLAVDEITTNIADHGYHGGEGVIDLESGIEADQVWIRIRDDSPPFDPRSHDSSGALQASLEQRELGGYGLLLALAKLDGFDYLSEGDRNVSVLRMSRSEPSADEPGTGSEDTSGNASEHSEPGNSDEGSRRWTARGR